MQHIVTNDFIYRLMNGKVPSGKEGFNVKIVPINDNIQLNYDKRNIRTTADIPNYTIYDENTNPNGVIEPVTAFKIEYKKTNEVRGEDVPTYIDSANSGNSAYSAIYMNVLNTYNYRCNYAKSIGENLAAYTWEQERLRMASGFFLVGNSDHLKYLANLCNASANGNNTFNMYICDSAFQYDGNYPIGTFERPYNGILFGNNCTLRMQKDSETNEPQKIYCNEYENGLIGCLGKDGIISDLFVEGEANIVCRKKITIDSVRDESRNIYFGTVVGVNYGLVRNIYVSAIERLKNFVPGAYCIGDKSESLRYYNAQDENYHYPDYFCVNASTNAIPYIGYFLHGQAWLTVDEKGSDCYPDYTDSTNSASMNNPQPPLTFGIMPNVMHTRGLSLSGIQKDWKPFKVVGSDIMNSDNLKAQFCNINSFSHLVSKSEFTDKGIDTTTPEHLTPLVWFHEEDQFEDEKIPLPIVPYGDPGQRLHQFSRVAYYVGGVIGMNAGSAINIHINQMKHNINSTFVGFIGGVVGKEVGNLVSDIKIQNVNLNIEDDFIPDKVVYSDSSEGDDEANKINLTFVEPSIYEYGLFCGEITTMSRYSTYNNIFYGSPYGINKFANTLEKTYVTYNPLKYVNRDLYYILDIPLCHAGMFAGVLQINGNDTETNEYTNVNIQKNNVLKIYTNLENEKSFIGYQSVDMKIIPTVAYAQVVTNALNDKIEIKDPQKYIFGNECCQLPIQEGVHKLVNLPGVYINPKQSFDTYFFRCKKGSPNTSPNRFTGYYPYELTSYLAKQDGRNYYSPAGSVLASRTPLSAGANSIFKVVTDPHNDFGGYEQYSLITYASNFIENHNIVYVTDLSLFPSQSSYASTMGAYPYKLFPSNTGTGLHEISKMSYNLAASNTRFYEKKVADPDDSTRTQYAAGSFLTRFDIKKNSFMHNFTENIFYSYQGYIYDEAGVSWANQAGYQQNAMCWYNNAMIVGNKNMYWGGNRHYGHLHWNGYMYVENTINNLFVYNYNAYRQSTNAEDLISSPFSNSVKEYSHSEIQQPILEVGRTNYQLYDTNYIGDEIVYGSNEAEALFSANISWNDNINSNYNYPHFQYKSNSIFNTANNAKSALSSTLCIGNCPSLNYVLKQFENEDLYKVDAYLINSKNTIDSLLFVDNSGNVVSIIDNIGQQLESGSISVDFSKGFITL